MRRLTIVVAAMAALLGAAALGIEADETIAQSLAEGHGLLEATFLYLRFFTILANIGLVALQAWTAWRLATSRPLPPGRLYDAALVYAIVTGVTYELLLRGLWSPQDLMFLSDIVLHDVTPAMMLATWGAVSGCFAGPRAPARWSDIPALLIFPAAFLAMTIVAGAWGEGYPYGFLDVAKLGLGKVLLVSLVFLVVFLVTGWAVAAAARRLSTRRVRCTSSS